MTCFTFAQTNDNNGKSMWPILNNMQTIIDTVEHRGFEIVRLEYDIVKTDSKASYRILTDVWTYRIGVIGDYRSLDMDIEVYKQSDDGTYILISQDNKTESFAYVDITPTTTGWYKFVVKCSRFQAGYNSCHYGLIIFHN